MTYSDYLTKIHDKMNKDNTYNTLPLQLENRKHILDVYKKEVLKNYNFFK